MKKLTVLLIALFLFTMMTQAHEDEKKQPNYIEVTGKAEIQVVPDEIYLSIILNEKDTKDKRSLADMESALIRVLRQLQIPTENLSIVGANSDLERAFWTGKKIYNRKQYELKITKASIIGNLLRSLEREEISNVNLMRTDHSKIEELKKEVRIQAIKSAKEKADYLLEAIGEKTGQPMVIQERNYSVPMYRNYAMSMEKDADDAVKESYELDFKEMKLESQIYVKFEIQEK